VARKRVEGVGLVGLVGVWCSGGTTVRHDAITFDGAMTRRLRRRAAVHRAAGCRLFAAKAMPTTDQVAFVLQRIHS
jgi:hypothetical protein